jgi:radical SAM superfamily enzyme YgiQ (UPF0313 family)
MKLLLVNPRCGRSGFALNSSSLFPPLGLGIVASLSPSHWEIELIDENFTEFSYRQADLVALTAFTAAAPRAYEIAAFYRRMNIPTIIGGAHASVCPDEALDHCDAVLIGEAESSWDLVLDDFYRGRLRGVYTGQPSTIATPNRSLFDTRYTRKTIQTSRGCPLDCDFCSVSTVNGAKYRSRPLYDVLTDLDEMSEHFFIIDDNFVGYGDKRRQEVIKILKHLIDTGNKRMWFCQTSINVGQDDELLELMSLAGCKMLFVGVETEDDNSLVTENHKRRIPCKESVATIHKHGMSVLGSFIMGLETDTRQSMLNRVEFIHNCGVDAYQASLMTPLPGTRLFDRILAQNKLPFTNFPTDWARYDFVDTVFVPDDFDSMAEFRYAVRECMDLLYDQDVIHEHAKTTASVTNSSPAAWFAYRSNYNYMNIYRGRLREETS